MKQNIIILTFILSLGTYYTKAQNLVYNGYFEINDTCPNNDNQITYAVGWHSYSNYAKPDYFNSCSGVVNVPNTMFGFQNDCCGGNGFGGGFMLDKTAPSNDDRDYMYSTLTNTLSTNHKYIVSMYVNRAEGVDYAIATIGMLLTDTSPHIQGTQTTILVNPQIKNTVLLSDTLNWILIQDTIVSNGTEAYLTIGNFNTSASSDSIKLTNYWSSFPIAYYYIDGVSIYDVTSDSCNNYWDAGFNKYIFAGDSIRLGAINTDNSTYAWVNSTSGATYLNSNTDAHPWATPSVTTTYYVTKTCPNNNVFYDTVTVYIQQHVGIKQLKDNVQINIYPNPNNGNMVLEYTITNDAILEFIDTNSKIVGRYNLLAGANKVNVSNEGLGNGVYFYHITDGSNLNKTGKIVIMK